MQKDLLEKIGVTSLSEMQLTSSESIRRMKNDVVILSPTGSGKTLAYLMPLIECIEREKSDSLRAIVMVPSRELARQSDDYAHKISKSIRTYASHGGRSAMYEHRELRNVNPQILFSTPGRLNDHIDKNNIDVSGVKWLVIDEFDKCLEFGFHDEMKKAIGRMPSNIIHILLSATDADSIPHFVNMNSADRIDYLLQQSPLEGRIGKYLIRSKTADKLDILASLLLTFGSSRSIVFAGYRDSVARISDYLQERGFICASLHGGMEQDERNEAVYHFINKSANILVSTNLSSRGLDLPDVDNIIHYHLPETEGDYVHHSGRTARWEAEGSTYFILGPKESLPEYVEGDVEEFTIPEHLPELVLPAMSTIYIGKGKRDKICKGDVLGLLCKKGGLDSSEIGRIDIFERFCRVAVSRLKMRDVLRKLQGEKIKGVKTVIEELR